MHHLLPQFLLNNQILRTIIIGQILEFKKDEYILIVLKKFLEQTDKERFGQLILFNSTLADIK